LTEHILEMAKALVRIKDGDIEVLTDPPIRRCPLRRELYGIDEESRESVARVLKIHMQKIGMYGPKRVLELRDMPVSFGASEVLCSALSEGWWMRPSSSAREQAQSLRPGRMCCRPWGRT